MLNGDHQEPFDESIQNNLLRDRLGHLDDRRQVELSGRGVAGGIRKGGRQLFPQIRIEEVKLLHFTKGAPTLVTGPGEAQVTVSGALGIPAQIKSSRDFVGDRFVLDEAILAGQANRFIVKLLRIQYPAFDAGNLGIYQNMFVCECRRATLPPARQLVAMGFDLGAPFQRGGVTHAARLQSDQGQCGEEMVIKILNVTRGSPQ
jgi:hypothetical protein